MPVLGFDAPDLVVPGVRLYPDGADRGGFLPGTAGLGQQFLGDNDFAIGFCGRIAAQPVLAFCAFLFALFQLLHFACKRITRFRRCINLPEFICPKVFCGSSAIPERILPGKAGCFVNIQRSTAFCAVRQGSTVPLTAFGTLHGCSARAFSRPCAPSVNR